MKDRILNQLRKSARDFLASRAIAVAGVSREPDGAGNLIYRRLRKEGYRVYATNPQTHLVEGDPCYPNLAAIPVGFDAVVITTPPDETLNVIRESINLGIRKVWIHRSFGHGSFDDEAVLMCKQHNISLIPGGCPMMFLEPVDPAHRCMRWLLKWTGGLPEPLENKQEDEVLQEVG